MRFTEGMLLRTNRNLYGYFGRGRRLARELKPGSVIVILYFNQIQEGCTVLFEDHVLELIGNYPAWFEKVY